MNPLLIFEKWFSEEKKQSALQLSAACCLSTLGLDGYPNARFVSLKEISAGFFVITGSLDSRKGIELKNCPKAALTFWWATTKRHVRVQGDVIQRNDAKASIYFAERNRDSQLVSAICKQGKEIEHIAKLQQLFETKKKEMEGKEIKRPKNWGIIFIKPVRIEFMEFKESRLHERTLYEYTSDSWKKSIIQP